MKGDFLFAIFILRTKIVLVLMIISLLTNGCVSPDQKMDLQSKNTSQHIFDEEVQLIKSQIIESSQLNNVIKSEGVEFNNALMNDPSKSRHYVNSLEMATNIGVYVADLNYIFAFEQDESKNIYLEAIFYLADKLDVENAFDRTRFDVLKEEGLLTKREKIDFLNTLVNEAEEKINSDARAQLVSLIVSGSWIEGMYINLELAKESWPNEVISKELIVHLDNYDRIKKLLGHFEDYQPCVDRLNELEKIEPMIEKIKDQDALRNKESFDAIVSAIQALRMKITKI